MTRLLNRSSLRFYWRHPWQLAIALVGIALGVGVFVGVQLANDSAARAFDLAAALVRGATTHRLVPLGDHLDETLYRELVVERGITTAAPVVEAQVGVGDRGALHVPLLGVDPLKERGIRSFATFLPGSSDSFSRLLTEPGTVLVPEAMATALGLTENSALPLRIGDREAVVTVAGTVASAAQDVTAEPPLIADIATAQELLGLKGKLSRIDLRLTTEEAERLAKSSFAGAALVSAGSEDRTFDELATAFRTNLTALGLLALVVGTFLIYGTMSFAIVRRRQTIGVLRAMGSTQREIVGSVLLEALVLGITATALGLALGHALALGLVEQVLRTIGDLYFRAGVTAARPSAWIYAEGMALGLGATLVAAARPAVDAARLQPAIVLRRASLEQHAIRAAHSGALGALPVLALGAALLTFGAPTLTMGFAGLFAILGGCALATPFATLLMMRGMEHALPFRRRLPVALALRGVTASLSRTGVATTALAVAIATVNGVGLMITSFRTSLNDWLGTTLTADLYLTADAPRALSDDELLERLRSLDGVQSISSARSIIVPTELGELGLRAYRPGERGWGVTIVAGDERSALDGLAAGRGVLVSERLMLARNLRVGDELTLPAARSNIRVPILGAYRDFNTGAYGVLMSLERYREAWQDQELTGLGLDLDGSRSALEVENAVRGLVGSDVRLRSSAAIEQLSLEVFDRTFRITEVLRLLAGVVAFLGVFSALLAIELERGREVAVLRAIGFLPSQLRSLLLAQTGLLGLAAGVIAMPIGIALAALLVHVINRRAFGWTMELVISPRDLFVGVVLALVAALLAGVYPAWRASRQELGAALREE